MLGLYLKLKAKFGWEKVHTFKKGKFVKLKIV